MNIIAIAILILIILLICLAQNKYIIYEDFSSDEAVQNISSLYNQSKLTVTDFTSTGKSALGTTTINNLTAPTISATNATINNTLTANVANINGILSTQALYSKGNASGSTHLPYSDGNNYLTSNNNILRGGPTTIQGNLQVDGLIQQNKERINVVYPIEWDQSKWIRYITNNNFFKRDMPDGTMIKFLFVHPGDMNPSHPNRWIRYCHVIKIGNQFILASISEHGNIPNPANNSSNDLSWRGNIN